MAALKTSFSGAILNEALTMGLNQGVQELLSQLLSKKFKGADFTRSLKYMAHVTNLYAPWELRAAGLEPPLHLVEAFARLRWRRWRWQ